jgi:hypothetical protein
VELQRQRAELSENGQGVKSAWLAEDRAIGDLLGIPYEKANRVKWVLATGFFDLIGLLAHLLAAQIKITAREIGEAAFRRAFDLAIKAGAEHDAAYQLARNAMDKALREAGGGDAPQQSRQSADAPPPARGEDEPRQTAAPAYRFGGRVDHHGLAELHGTPDKPEFVLSPEMTQALGGADVLEALRARVHDMAGAPPAAADMRRDNVTSKRDTVRDTSVTREHVPAHLSGQAAKGRKGLIDTCPTCKQDFIVTAWNKVYCCDDCAARASGFNDAETRKSAWAKGRKA